MLFHKKVFAYIKISRPLNSFITFLVIIVACVININGSYSVLKIILAGLTGALTASAGNVINDYFDINSDKINHPTRPLPSGSITKNDAAILYLLFFLSALALSVLINGLAFLIVLISSNILFLYSFRLKHIALFGNLVVAFLTGLVFIYGGIAVGNIKNAFIPALFAFLINFIREIVKDMEDKEGDTKVGIISFPIKYGFSSAKNLILAAAIILIAFTFYPFLTQYYKIEYFLVVMIIVNPVLVYFLKSLFKDDSHKSLNKLSFILKLEMIFGLIAIYLGKFNRL